MRTKLTDQFPWGYCLKKINSKIGRVSNQFEFLLWGCIQISPLDPDYVLDRRVKSLYTPPSILRVGQTNLHHYPGPHIHKREDSMDVG